MSSTVQSLVFDTDLLSLLPEWYRQVLDYQQMCQTGQAQLEAAATAVQSIADNLFFQTMDESSIALWEQALGITPEGEVHADGLTYKTIDMSVAASMFVADLRSGKNLYYPLYPMGLPERLAGIKPQDLAKMSQEFYDLYR